MGSVFTFFSLTYLISWSCWFAAIAILQRVSGQPSPVAWLLLMAGTITPAVVALVLTAYSGNKAGPRSFLSRVIQTSVSLRWYVFAIFYMPAIKGAVALSHLALTGEWPPFGEESPVVIGIAILLSTPVQSGEEIGWRGYALPAIAARIGLRSASIVVGLVWGAWHLPLFFLPGADKYGQSFPLYVTGVVAFSVAIAWLYGHTQGSLLLAMLMHSSLDQTIGIVSDILRPGQKPFALGASLPFLLTVAWMWVTAGYFFLTMPPLPVADRARFKSGLL